MRDSRELNRIEINILHDWCLENSEEVIDSTQKSTGTHPGWKVRSTILEGIDALREARIVHAFFDDKPSICIDLPDMPFLFYVPQSAPIKREEENETKQE